MFRTASRIRVDVKSAAESWKKAGRDSGKRENAKSAVIIRGKKRCVTARNKFERKSAVESREKTVC